MIETVKTNLDAFSLAIDEYVAASGKSASEALAKKGDDFAYDVQGHFRGLKPAKGSIAASQQQRLKSSPKAGIKIRPSILARASVGAKFNLSSDITTRKVQGKATVRVKGKSLNLQQYRVMLELRAREAGRGYLGFAGAVRSKAVTPGNPIQKKGRYYQTVATASLHSSILGSSLTFLFGGTQYDGQPVGIVHALEQSRQQQTIAASLSKVTDDMLDYVPKGQVETLRAKLQIAERSAPK